MIEINVTRFVQADPVRLFRFIANPENNPQWQGGMKSCVLTNGADLRVGSEYDQVAVFMGKEIVTKFEITEFEADHFIKGESRLSSFPITFKRIVEAHKNGAQVTAIVTGDPSGFLKIVPFFTKWMVNKSIKGDYKRLKTLMEQSNN